MNNHHDILRRTKILATLGPASDDPDVLEKMIAAGVNVVRINCSHGNIEKQKERIANVRAIMKKTNRWIGILADLQGPKIRISCFKTGKIELKENATFTLDAALDCDQGDASQVGIDYKNLPRDVAPNDILLLDDGRIRLRVDEVLGDKIHTMVEIGGPLSNHKGINRLGGGLSAPALTEKDIIDLKAMLAEDVDFIAVSFPRDASDMETARDYLVAAKSNAGLIAKIERKEAMDNLDEIIAASDGVMVARGDLSVEIGDAEVPLAQRRIIQRSRALNKPVIIATQMMESMIQESMPTRAEVSDIATAVLWNADAVMLSAESAVGKYPIKAVQAMANICRTVEKYPDSHLSNHRVECNFKRVDEAVAMATMYTANHLNNIRAIICLTESGTTPLLMSRIRTAIPIFGLSRYKKTLCKMCLYRGIYPVYFDPTSIARDDVNLESIQVMEQHHILSRGDMVILTKGDHMGVGGGSNAMKILQVGSVV
jgi:pyruvate kinase